MDNRPPKEEFTARNTPEIKGGPELLDSEEILKSHMNLMETDGTGGIAFKPYHYDRYWGGSHGQTQVRNFPAKKLEIKIDGINREFTQYYALSETEGEQQYMPYSEDSWRPYSDDDYKHHFSRNPEEGVQNFSPDSIPGYAREFIEGSISTINPFKQEKLFDGYFEISSHDPREDKPMFLGFADTDELIAVDSGFLSSFRRPDGELSGETAVFSGNLAGETIESLTQKEDHLNDIISKLQSELNQDIMRKHILILEGAKSYIEKEKKYTELMESDPAFLDAYFGEATPEKPITFTNNENKIAMQALGLFAEGKHMLISDTDGKSARVTTPASKWIHQHGVSIPEVFEQGGLNFRYVIPGIEQGAQSQTENIFRISHKDDQYVADLTTWLEQENLAADWVENPDNSHYATMGQIICPTLSRNLPTLKTEYKTYKNGQNVYEYIYSGEQPTEIYDPEIYLKIAIKMAYLEEEYRDRERTRYQEKQAAEQAEKKAWEYAQRAAFSTFFANHPVTPDGSLGLAMERSELRDDNYIYAINSYLNSRNNQYLVLDKNKITIRENNGRKEITLHGVPDDIRGQLIGKKGSNINRLAQEIGVDFIRIS